MASTNGNRVAIIAGCRTPFCRAGSELKSFSAVDLARHATVELLHRAGTPEFKAAADLLRDG